MSRLKSDTKPAGPYSAAENSRLILHSFYFSQGNLATHDQIFAHLARNHGDRLQPDVIFEGGALAYDSVKAVLRNRALHTDQGRPTPAAFSIAEATSMLKRHLDGPRPGFDQTALTRGLIHADFGSLIGRRAPGKQGRRRKLAAGEKITPAKDRFLSHFVYYGLMAKATPMVEYDDMFAESVQDFADNPKLYKSHRKRAQRVVDLHLEHHADHTPILAQRLGALGIENIRLPEL